MTNTDKEQTHEQKRLRNQSSAAGETESLQNKKSILWKYQESRNYWQSKNYVQGTFIVTNIHATCIPFARKP